MSTKNVWAEMIEGLNRTAEVLRKAAETMRLTNELRNRTTKKIIALNERLKAALEIQRAANERHRRTDPCQTELVDAAVRRVYDEHRDGKNGKLPKN